jgi:hypothetical protein
MVRCPRCGYLIPEAWSSCRGCGAPLSAPTDPSDQRISTPAQWSPPSAGVPVAVTMAAAEWRRPSVSLIATAAGFVLVLMAVFALPWMRVGGGFFHIELSYKQMQDLLSGTDFFSRVALDLGPVILLADLIVVGRCLATRGRVGVEALAAPIGLACLVLYVTAEIHSFSGAVNGDAVFGVRAGTGSGPWVCILGCACLVVGALAGSGSGTTTGRPRSRTLYV